MAEEASQTRGKARPVSALMMAVVGVLIFTVLLVEDVGLLPQDASASLPWGLIGQYAVAMAMGGALAGALLSGLFGRGGAGGWFLAAWRPVLLGRDSWTEEVRQWPAGL